MEELFPLNLRGLAGVGKYLGYVLLASECVNVDRSAIIVKRGSLVIWKLTASQPEKNEVECSKKAEIAKV